MPDQPATQPVSVVRDQPVVGQTALVVKPPALATDAIQSPAPADQFAKLQAVKPQAQAIILPGDTKYVTLLDALVEAGAIDAGRSNELLAEHIRSGRTIEDLVTEKKEVTADVLTQAKAKFYKIPYVNLSLVGIYPEALGNLSESLARYYKMLPFAYSAEENSLSVAMENPLDLTAVDFVEQKTGLKLKTYYAPPEEIERKLAENYSQSLSSEVQSVLEQTKSDKKTRQEIEDLSAISGGTIRQAPINKIVQTILSFALKSRASDVHIEPQEEKTRVRYRIDGILSEKLILPKTVHDAVISRIKILSGLKIDERRVPQDGRFDFESGGQQVDLRISTLPTIHGEKVVMRLLKKNSSVPTMEELGLTNLSLRHMRDAIKVPHGIVLITGPTGSGKTTTLYSLLHTINTPRVNIMTLEDPVEYQMPGVNQVQVNPPAGLTFASGLRSFLRQDPNIIMVGEIRDSETAGLAVQAALTGHLVFSTLHTSSAAGAIPRLIDMEAEPFLLASSMTLVAAQRIARRINPKYKETYKPEPAVLEDIKNVLGGHLANWLKQQNKTEADIVLYRAKTDRPETEPEYMSRVAIFEVMRMNEEIGRLIMAEKPAIELEKAAIKNGMLLMKQDGYIKVLEGLTTIEEVLRVAQI
ncbi:GspE/PulE family protein [Patescibacteria group bacterium]|nr:GspE/PulE family protein [Patescibacteria group bacterium]